MSLQVSLVDEEGKYTDETGPEFCGKYVLTDGVELTLNKIQKDVLHKEEIVHSYPYDWRTKKPLILRASHQWFINTNALKEKAIVICIQLFIVKS